MVIGDLAQVHAECLTPAFVDAVNGMTQGMDGFCKSSVIRAVATVPAERLTPDFIAAANRLSDGMEIIRKSNVIGALANVPAKHLTPAFEALVNRLSDGMGGSDKELMISALLSVKHFDSLMNAFTDQTLQELTQYVPSYARIDLIERLTTRQPNQWQAEITQLINEYRHDNEYRHYAEITQLIDPYGHNNAGARAAHPGVLHEVHYYANTQVTPGTTRNC